MSNETNYRSVRIAAAVAGVLMLASGIVHRLLAARMAASTSAITIPADLLDGLPLRIGEWSGKDIPLNDAIVRQTDTDVHINRLYSHSRLGSASLYIGCGSRIRELMVHRPEVCYIGAGWTRTARHSRTVSLADGESLPCVIFEFSRGVLGVEKIGVLHYYIVDGQYCRDLSEWQHRFWSIRYVTNVQIVVPSEGWGGDSAEDSVSGIAREFGPHIIGLFDRLDDEYPVDASQVLGEQK